MRTSPAARTPGRHTRRTAAERRHQVLAAAIREFAEQGYQAASTAAIARRAGISQPYIYALFPSKQDLFIAVHDQVIGHIVETFRAAATAGSTPQERLDRMGEAYPTLIADRYELLAQLQTYATGDPVIQAHAARSFRRLFDEVARLSGATRVEVALFFACGMLANVTTALGLEDLCAPLFDADVTRLANPAS